MTISTRTIEGEPNRCHVCGAVFHIDPSRPAGDAPCPNCGQLLWWFQERFSDSPDPITLESAFVGDLKADSLDVVELVMEFEDQFDIVIPDDEYENLRTVGDVLRFIAAHRKEPDS